jgi:hypothetical protein
MWFLCIKHEYSCISFENNVSFVWIFKILNMYKYRLYYYNIKFIWVLYEPMKNEFYKKKIVQTYKAW